MRVIVIIGRVLDPAGIVVNRRRGRIFVNREEYILQPADRCALEAALRVKDATAAEVVALPRSPLPDDDVLRQALATGADRAITLAGDGIEKAGDAVMSRILIRIDFQQVFPHRHLLPALALALEDLCLAKIRIREYFFRAFPFPFLLFCLNGGSVALNGQAVPS